MRSIFFFFILTLLGCSKVVPVSVSTRPLPFTPTAPTLDQLRKMSVDNLEIVIFKSGISSQRWAEVFSQTSELHHLRNEVHRIRAQGELSSEEESQVDRSISRVSEILISLFENDTAYLLEWSALENCSLSDEATPRMTCVPFDESIGVNPLNGGMPEVISAFTIEPSNVKRREKTPSIAMTMKSKITSDGMDFGSFEFRLRLKWDPQADAKAPWVLKGEVDVLPGSHFLRLGERIDHAPIGYAELRLVPAP